MAINAAVKGLNVKLSTSIFSGNYALLKKNTQKLDNELIKYVTGGGGTDLARAVTSSGYYLAGAAEERKIMICITDGHVDDDVVHADAIARSAGIEVYYIIIGSAQHDSEWMVQNSPIEARRCVPFWGDFTGQFLSMFKDLLLNGEIKK
jgi:hypothetical protein